MMSIYTIIILVANLNAKDGTLLHTQTLLTIYTHILFNIQSINKTRGEDYYR